MDLYFNHLKKATKNPFIKILLIVLNEVQCPLGEIPTFRLFGETETLKKWAFKHICKIGDLFKGDVQSFEELNEKCGIPMTR